MNLWKWSLAGTVFVSALGSILHFVYEWSEKSVFWGIWGAVNESTWEHLKLLFWPAVFFSIAEYFFWGYRYKNFLPVKFFSILTGMAIIVTVFYTYSGILGKNLIFMDILTFFLGAAGTYCFSFYFIQKNIWRGNRTVSFSALMILVLALCFILFTFIPPYMGLFRDPVSAGYGIL